MALGITLRMAFRARRWGAAGLLALIPLMHVAYGLAEWAELIRPGRDFGERRN